MLTRCRMVRMLGLDRLRRMLQQVASCPGRAAAASIQTSAARKFAATAGGWCAAASMSPRLISSSSSSVSVTDMRRHCPVQIAVEGGDALHAAGSARRQRDDAIARPHRPGGNLSRKAAIVLVGTDHALHRQAKGRAGYSSCPVGTVSRYSSSVGPSYHGMLCAAVDHVVAVQRADGNGDQTCEMPSLRASCCKSRASA